MTTPNEQSNRLADELIEGMEQFADDLESGDLSGYQITLCMTCMNCGKYTTDNFCCLECAQEYYAKVLS